MRGACGVHFRRGGAGPGGPLPGVAPSHPGCGAISPRCSRPVFSVCRRGMASAPCLGGSWGQMLPCLLAVPRLEPRRGRRARAPGVRSFLKHVREPSSWVIRGWAAVPSQLGVSWGRCISARGWQKWSQDPAPVPLASPEPVSRPCYLLNCFAMYSLYFGEKKKKWPLHAVLLNASSLLPPCPRPAPRWGCLY